jgi:hypothetical protein
MRINEEFCDVPLRSPELRFELRELDESTVSLIEISGPEIDASKSGEDGMACQMSDSRFA